MKLKNKDKRKTSYSIVFWFRFRNDVNYHLFVLFFLPEPKKKQKTKQVVSVRALYHVNFSLQPHFQVWFRIDASLLHRIFICTVPVYVEQPNSIWWDELFMISYISSCNHSKKVWKPHDFWEAFAAWKQFHVRRTWSWWNRQILQILIWIFCCITEWRENR